MPWHHRISTPLPLLAELARRELQLLKRERNPASGYESPEFGWSTSLSGGDPIALRWGVKRKAHGILVIVGDHSNAAENQGSKHRAHDGALWTSCE
jgi:hypothetical protein